MCVCRERKRSFRIIFTQCSPKPKPCDSSDILLIYNSTKHAFECAELENPFFAYINLHFKPSGCYPR